MKAMPLVPASDMTGCQAYRLLWSSDKTHYQLNSPQTELYATWPAKLVLRDDALRAGAVRSYHERLWQHYHNGWNLDIAFAACLGLQDEVAQWHDQAFRLNLRPAVWPGARNGPGKPAAHGDPRES